jgi:hypothetical protein
MMSVEIIRKVVIVREGNWNMTLDKVKYSSGLKESM